MTQNRNDRSLLTVEKIFFVQTGVIIYREINRNREIKFLFILI